MKSLQHLLNRLDTCSVGYRNFINPSSIHAYPGRLFLTHDYREGMKVVRIADFNNVIS
jgi:hypothetical protein